MSRITAVAITMAALLAVPATAKDKHDYGPAPDWTRYRELGAPAVLAQLPEPSAWSVRWPYGYRQGGWVRKGADWGYQTCGYAEHESESGGVRRVPFAIIIDHDRVLMVDVRPVDGNSIVDKACGFLVSSGRLPPASMLEATVAVAVARLGISVRPVPEGACVANGAATPQVPGLAAGTVIVRVNGISLAGLGSTVARMLEQPGELTLETATGQIIRLPATKVR